MRIAQFLCAYVIAFAMCSLSTFTVLAQLPTYLPADGLVAWYPFNGNANDESGNGNNGVVYGATLTDDRFGATNAAYSFNSSYIEVPNSSDFTFSNFSFSLWIKSTTSTPQTILKMAKFQGAELETFGFGVGSFAQLQFGANYNDANCIPGFGWQLLETAPNTDLLDNTYHHFVCTANGSIMSMYIDGQFYGSLETGNNPLSFCPGGDIQIGRNWSTFLNYYIGVADDIGIWNRPLSAQEAQSLFNAPESACAITASAAVICPGETVELSVNDVGVNSSACSSNQLPTNLQNGLVAYYPFCGNANDASGNGNNGVVNGASLTTDRFGSQSAAYRFNGTTDYISGSCSQFPTSSRTISYWFKSNLIDDQSWFFGYGGGNCGSSCVLYANSNQCSVTSLTSINYSGHCCNRSFNVPINSNGEVWHHLAITSSTDSKVYLDGDVVYTGLSLADAFTLSRVFYLGAATDPSGTSIWGYYNGDLDDIFIYNRALTASEIQQLFASQSCNWSTGATTPSITVAPTETTTYSVTVTQDGQTCTSDVTVTVNQPSAEAIEATITEGETYDFNGQSLAVAGTYEAVLVNAAGCDSVVTLTLTVNPALTCEITASATSICAGESVELSVDGGAANATSCTSNQLPANLQNGLVAYYPFCGNANDASGNGNDGFAFGVDQAADRFGRADNAYNFNEGDYIEINNSSGLYQGIGTFGFWINTSSNKINMELLKKGNFDSTSSGEEVSFALNTPNSGMCVKYNSNCIPGFNWYDAASATNLRNGVWHLIVGVIKPFQTEYYIDGVLMSTINVPNELSDICGGNINIGRNWISDTDYYEGKFDDLFIWNRPLSPSEISQLYVDQSVLWSTGATTPSITVTPTETTTYSVSVTQDGQTCTSDVTITVNQPSASSIEATIPEGETYGFNGQSLAVAGTYEAVLENAAGCDSVVTLTLTVNPALSCEITASATSICGSALTCASNELPANLQNGLIAYYPFCGNALDASGNGNDGLVNGAQLSADRFGNAASAYYFNGVNSRIDLSSINESGDFSISYWEKINEVKFSYPIGLGVNTTNFYNGYGIGQSGYTGECAIPANIHFVFDGLTECTNLMYSSAESVSQEWRLVSFTYEQGNSKLYYNGNLVSESTELDYPGFFMLTLGIRSDSAFPFDGWIDDVLVHNRALEMSEIQGLLTDSGVELEIALSENDPLASACTSSQLPTNLQNGLIAFYPFCGNANDASGNGNDGQVSGALLSSDRFGSAASAYYFNGVNSRIDLSNINETGDFSITYWEKINQVKFAYPVGLGVNTTNFYNGYGIGQSGYTGECAIPANIHFVFDGLTECTNLMFASGQSVAQQWRLVSFTHEQGNSKLYYNGNLVSESSELDYPGFFLLTLGVRSDSAFPFDGWIDDVLVHNRALSAAEIQSLNGEPIAQVLWSTGATTPSITVAPNETTTYSVTVTQDGQTCTSDVTIEVLPTETFYADNDGDGFGDANNSITSCTGQPQGYVSDNTDCDDSNSAVFIGASCDDGDACTEGDIVRGDCTCAGTYTDDDQDGTCNALDLCAFGPEPGTACDDNNPCTIGDSIQDDCTCAGQLSEPETSLESAHACEPYEWNGQVYTQSGTYTYATTNALGCDSIATLELTVGAPSSSSTTINACNGYPWNGQAYTQSGTYTFVTSNASGCDSTATLVLTIQSPSVAPTAINASALSVTVGGSVTLSVVGGSLGTGAQWKWYSTSCGGQLIGTGNSITVAVNATTSFFVRAEGDCNVTSCASVTITANAIPCGPQSVAASALSVCYGSSTMLTVSGQLNTGAAWKWYKNGCGSGVVVGTGSSLAVLPTATTTYFVRAEGGTCGITSCQSITITVNPAPAQPAFIQGPVSGLCGLQGVSYSTPAVSGATSYVWSVPTGATIVSGQGTNAIVVNYGSSLGINTVCGATSICVRSVNACGSSALRCVNLSLAPATPGAITGQSIVCRTQSYTYSIAPVAGATSYTWTVPSTWQITSGQGTTSITVVAGTMNGEVRVLANNACGSSKIARRSVTTFVCSNPGMTMLDEMPELALWPNPAQEVVHLDVDQIIPDKVEIYDMLGKRMYEGAWTNEFDVTLWPSGMYIVRVTLGEEHLIQRLEIAH